MAITRDTRTVEKYLARLAPGDQFTIREVADAFCGRASCPDLFTISIVLRRSSAVESVDGRGTWRKL